MSALRHSRLGKRQRSERRRGGVALLVSLLLHGLLLSLSLGGQGGGLPSLSFLWQDRRAEAPELQVVLAQPQLPMARPAPAAAPAPAPAAAAAAAEAAMGTDTATARARATASVQATPVANDTSVANANDLPTGRKTLSASNEGPPVPVPPPVDAPPLLSTTRPDDASWSVPPAPEVPPPTLSEAASSPAPTRLQRRESVGLETARADLAGLDAAKQDLQERTRQLEAARLAAERAAAARQEEAARQEALKQEALRQEALKQEAARQLAARQAAAQQEAARVEAQRQAAQQLAAAQAAQREAARQEANRLAAAESARQAAALEAAKAAAQALASAAAAAEAEQREARLRAIGRQMDEEAAKRDAERRRDAERKTLPSSWSSARRARLFGRADTNQDLVLYAEALARKIQLDVTAFEQVREPAKLPHTDPMVTMAIRADGSVESVNFVRSSGLPALDEAIRRVIQTQANYPAFPPNLAREYDVIEIRRTWQFDSAIRLY